MKFTKMHGIGNDYVYMDCTKERLEIRARSRGWSATGTRASDPTA